MLALESLVTSWWWSQESQVPASRHWLSILCLPKGRGVLLREGQNLTDLYEERTPLYEKYADIVIDEEGKDLEASLEILLKTLKEN